MNETTTNIEATLTSAQWRAVDRRLFETNIEFVCEKCGFAFHVQFDGCYSTGPFAYCPGCGRRITRKEDQ